MGPMIALLALCLGVPAPLAPAPAPGRTVLELPWGRGPGQVGGVMEDRRVGEGIPAAFLAAGSSTWVLDTVNQRILAFGPGRGVPRAIALTGPGMLVPGAYATDLAVSPSGDLYVADGTDQSVLHLAAGGRPIGRFGHLGEVGRMEWTRDGSLAIADQAALAVKIFSPDGQPRGEVSDPAITPIEAGGGFLLGRTVLLEAYAVGTLAGGRPATLALLRPHTGSGGILGGAIVGCDGSGRIYVWVVEGEGDHKAGEWLYRLDEHGGVLAQLRIEPILGLYLTLRRLYRVTPDGSVLSFARNDRAWRLVAFDFDRKSAVVDRTTPRSPLTAPTVGTTSASQAGPRLPAAERLATVLAELGFSGSAQRFARSQALLEALALECAFTPEGRFAEWLLASIRREVSAPSDREAVARFAIAHRALARGDTDRALALAEGALRARGATAPFADELAWIVAQAYDGKGNSAMALKAYQRLVLQYPQSRHYSEAQHRVLALWARPGGAAGSKK